MELMSEKRMENPYCICLRYLVDYSYRYVLIHTESISQHNDDSYYLVIQQWMPSETSARPNSLLSI